MNAAVIRVSKKMLRISSITIFRMRSLKAVKVSSEIYSEQPAGPCRARYSFQMCTKLR